MATVFYPAIVERAGDGFSVYFPDLPGCTSAGASVNEALVNATEALEGYLEVSAEHGDAIAEPSELDTIVGDPEGQEVARSIVRGEKPGRALRVQISLDEQLLARVDRVAKNRSGFIADALRAALAGR